MADYIEAWAQRIDLQVSRQAVLPDRDNVIVELRVGKPQHTLVFESHMDTVSIGSMEDALVPTHRDGLLYGRGSCDTKATMAGMLYAMEQAAEARHELPGDIVLCAAIDEEFQFRGISHFVREWQGEIAGAVVGEPTELKIVIAHKGIARFAVRTHGKAAHSAVPHEGNSAIFQMVEVLRFLRDEFEPSLGTTSHPLVGSPTIVAGTIKGGTQVNIVPESCEIQIDRRVIPGESARQTMEEFERQLAAATVNRAVDFSVHELLLDNPLDTLPNAPIVLCATDAAAKLGLATQTVGVPYGTDASKLNDIRGVPTIVYGPGTITKAHTRDEYVPVAEVEQAAEFYLEMARTFGSVAAEGND
jgi:acetylornithine deacetylase